VTPLAIAAAFGKALGRVVYAEAVPRGRWEEIFRAQGMGNPQPRMQIIDGFNQGWIDFPHGGASARKGRVALDRVIADLVWQARDFGMIRRSESGGTRTRGAVRLHVRML
jgi:hypothetical protein